MACEDYPCCGHEAGCCPDFDESGRQLNMRCTCGAVLPVHNRYSICDSCLRRGSPEEQPYDGWEGCWGGDGSGMDDLADYNANEADDYAYEGMEDQWLDGSYEE